MKWNSRRAYEDNLDSESDATPERLPAHIFKQTKVNDTIIVKELCDLKKTGTEGLNMQNADKVGQM